jgi:hypothetical protein
MYKRTWLTSPQPFTTPSITHPPRPCVGLFNTTPPPATSINREIPPMMTAAAARKANKLERHSLLSFAYHRHLLTPSAPTLPDLYHAAMTTPDTCRSFTTAPPGISSPSHCLQSPPPPLQYNVPSPGFTLTPAAPSAATTQTMRANNTWNLCAHFC